MEDWQLLEKRLNNLEGRNYRDYRAIKGNYAFPQFDLTVDYVQGDPFAAPSRVRIRLAQSVAQFPSQWLIDYVRQTAIADYLTRQVTQVAQSLQQKRGSGKSGQY